MKLSEKKGIVKYLRPKAEFCKPASFFYGRVLRIIKNKGFENCKIYLHQVVNVFPERNKLVLAEAKGLLSMFIKEEND